LPVESINDISAQKVVLHTSNLNHPPFSFIPFYEMLGKPRWQVDVKESSIVKEWFSTVDINWLRKASNEFVDKWIAEYGKKSKRPVNNIVKINLTNKLLEISYEFEEAFGFDNTKIITLPSKSSKGSATLTTKSSDFLFVMRQIADLNIVGNIAIKADTYAINFEFSSTVNDYQVTIPSSNRNGKRYSKHFTNYKPIQSSNPTFNYELDDDEPDMTEKEKKQLIKRLDRMRHRAKSR